MAGSRPVSSEIRLRPRADTQYVSQGSTVLATSPDGFFDQTYQRGLYVYQTRLLSRYRWLVDGDPVELVSRSNVDQHSWMGYYMAPPVPAGDDPPVGEPPQHLVELTLRRFVGDGLHEDIDLTNYAAQPVAFTLALELDADFADLVDVEGLPIQLGEVERRWEAADDGPGELHFDWQARHAYDHDGEQGVAELNRGVSLRFPDAHTPPSFEDGRIEFEVALEPHQQWHTCIDVIPRIDGEVFEPLYRCGSLEGVQNDRDVKRGTFFHYATDFEAPGTEDERATVIEALQQAKRDLVALRMYEYDRSDRDWLPAAGLPVYVNLFGRDTLTTTWQAAMLTPDMLRCTLEELALWQGTEDNPWREEQPGKMLHQARSSPTAELNYTPFQRHYGSITTSAFYPVTVSELWHWTGNREAVDNLVGPALEALEWLDEYGDKDGDGFYEYVSRSAFRQKNQAWKDSDEAIAYADGTQVPNPIATCEEQGYVYAAKLQLSEVLWWCDRKDEARRLFDEARALKQRFNEVFWLDDENFFAMALDPDNRPVRTISSNPGHCLATGIVDEQFVEPTIQRLFEQDLYSGWGIRTLSDQHPAYNPLSYQRGTVWPVEQGTFALGLMRYGYRKHGNMLTKTQFDLASLFDFSRLPEVVSGHRRGGGHPFPAVYPESNWPQAWSSSALVLCVQAMLGLYPYAPLDVLVVDPELPDWLPDLTLRGLNVGDARVDLRFHRDGDGGSTYEVLDNQGALRVVRQPSPWSMHATFARRTRDLLTSLVA